MTTETPKTTDAPEFLECFKDEGCEGPVIARLVYIGQGYHLGQGVCHKHAVCVDADSKDGELGTVMDSDHDEPFCDRHAKQYKGEEAVSGPDIVLLGSDRYREIVAEVGAE